MVELEKRWIDNIKMDLKEIMYQGLEWIRVNQDTVQGWAFVNKVMKLLVL